MSDSDSRPLAGAFNPHSPDDTVICCNLVAIQI